MILRSRSRIKPPAAVESFEWDDDEPLAFVIERLRDRRARSNEEEGDDDVIGRMIIDEDYEVESGKRRRKGRDVPEELQGIGYDGAEESVHQALVDDVIQNVAHEEVEQIMKQWRIKNRRKRLWKRLNELNDKWAEDYMDGKIEGDRDDEVGEVCEQPADLCVPLLGYQKEWLAWAVKKESKIKGGILADEKGMGTTIQAIALVMYQREMTQTDHQVREPPFLHGSSNVLWEIKSTLVICPVTAVIQWENDIRRCTSAGSTNLLVYHGVNRDSGNEDFSLFDIVIMTYDVVVGNYYKKQEQGVTPGKRASDENGLNLHSVMWKRIILDEAHHIKKGNSRHYIKQERSTFKAVFALKSSYRWAFIGTPLLSYAEELLLLVRFLRIFPYSHYMCEYCDCAVLARSEPSFMKPVSLNFSEDSEKCECSHHRYDHFSWLNKFVIKPIRQQGTTGEGKKALILLNYRILPNILLRRTKKDRAADLALPRITLLLRRYALDIEEGFFYRLLYGQTRAQFNAYVQRGLNLTDVRLIFCFLTRLQQAVNHPILVIYGSTEKPCCVCRNQAKASVVMSCSHVFCKGCISESSTGQTLCPSCEIPVRVQFAYISSSRDPGAPKLGGFKTSSILNQLQLDDFRTSTKIEALSGINCVQLVGSMTMPAKNKAVTRFNEDPECRIFLTKLQAGSVSLDLTVASYVFLMEPAWNAAVERQAINWIHRIGQHKPIRIVKFIIENTVEERLLVLQEKKDQAPPPVLALRRYRDDTESDTLSVDDLKFLFEC
ncbi:ATP-dependent helicase rhp16-like protein [Drosera capensis]